MVATEQSQKPQTWREKFLRHWMQTRLGHEGMMLEKIQRQSRIVEQLAAQTREGKFSGGAVASVPEDEMGVSIGNEVHHHYPEAAKTLGTLGKLLLALSLLAGGAGVGAVLTELLAPDPPPAVDTDTATDVTFPESPIPSP